MDIKQAAKKSACHMNMFFCLGESGAGAQKMVRTKRIKIKTSSARMLIVAPRGSAKSGNPSAIAYKKSPNSGFVQRKTSPIEVATPISNQIIGVGNMRIDLQTANHNEQFSGPPRSAILSEWRARGLPRPLQRM